MKATELRIGNYCFNNGSVKQVTVNTLEDIAIAERVWIKPIPLTPEWLTAFGFIKDENTSYRWFYGDWLAYDLDDSCVRVGDSWDFKKHLYVHDMQNSVFALKGVELVINSQGIS